MRAEIDARESMFSKLDERAQQMILKDHYAADNINEKMSKVKRAYEKVKSEWELREQWLRQLVQWHSYQREAKQCLEVIAARGVSSFLFFGNHVSQSMDGPIH